jgi:hypothetical protein
MITKTNEKGTARTTSKREQKGESETVTWGILAGIEIEELSMKGTREREEQKRNENREKKDKWRRTRRSRKELICKFCLP